MFQLIEQCVSGSDKAWGDLWDIYHHRAHGWVCRLLVDAGFDEGDADDVAIGVFEHLVENDCGVLQTFEGTTESQFATWLVHISINYARNWMDREWRRLKRQEGALRGYRIDDHSAPTVAEVLSLIDDLKSILSPTDIDHLRQLIGESAVGSGSVPPDPHVPVSARTWRRWKKELERKLRGL